MNCPQEFRLAVYADGELPATESGEVAAHLDACHACKETVRLYQLESAWIAASLRELDAEVLTSQETIYPARGRVWPLAAFVGGLAAVLAVVLAPLRGIEMPAGFEWLDPSSLQTQIALLVSGFFYVLEDGAPTMASIVSSVSLGILNLSVLVGLVCLLYRRVKIPTAGLMAALMLVVLAAPSQAIDIRSAQNGALTVGPDEVVDDTLVVFARSIDIEGTVTGGVIAFGFDVNVRGNVGGNVIAGARRVNLDGVVGGDVFAFAQTVTTSGEISGNLWAFNESTIEEDGSNVGGNATVFGADGSIDGRVGRDLTMYGAVLNVGGLVERRVNFTGNQLIIRAPAFVGGNVSATVTQEDNVQIDPAARIGGTQSIELREVPEFSRYSQFARIGFYVRQMLRIITGFVLGLLLFWVLPGLGRVNLGDARTLAVSGGVGFVALVAMPVAALVLAVTLIGLPLSIMTISVWVMGLYIAKIMVAQFIGAAVIGRKPNGVTTALGLLFGLVVVILAVNIPFVGGLINFLLLLVGMGALGVGLYGLISGIGAQQDSPQPAG